MTLDPVTGQATTTVSPKVPGKTKTPFGHVSTPLLAVGAALFVAAGAAAAYHGYKRNGGDKGAAAAWGLGGLIFPPVLLTALQQGYAEPSEKLYLQRIIGDINNRPDLLAAMNEFEFGY